MFWLISFSLTIIENTANAMSIGRIINAGNSGATGVGEVDRSSFEVGVAVGVGVGDGVAIGLGDGRRC